MDRGAWRALEKNPLHGHLFEGNPVGEGTDLSSTDIPVHRPETPAGFTHSSTRGLWPPEQLERQAGFPSSDKWQFAHPQPLSLLQRGLAPRSKGKARAELRPARRQARLPHSRSLLLPGRER